MNAMAKEPRQQAPKQDVEPEAGFPSRDGYKSTYLPKEIYDALEVIAKGEERSVAYHVRVACKQYLERLRKKKAATPED